MASTEQWPADKTFGTYTTEQARQYAIGRSSSYPPEIYNKILQYHESTGGQLQKLVDDGCGPGKATQDLAPFFDTAIGIDHSKAMIEVARSAGYKAKQGPIQFEVGPGETFDVPGLEPGSVDLITAAMAAHWFDMQAFWKGAANALKPGGTVALWTCASHFVHPSTTNVAEVQKILFDLEYNMLGPYVLPGNKISQGMYDDLKLPWQVDQPVAAFDERDFKRIEWNRDGQVTEGEDFLVREMSSVDEIERALSTASMVTRWRQANPELVGTDQDCVKLTIRRLTEALGGRFEFKSGHGVALLLFKKSKS